MIIIIFGAYYMHLLAKDCQIPPRQYSDIAQAIFAIQGNMHNKHRAAPLSSHAKVVYIMLYSSFKYCRLH